MQWKAVPSGDPFADDEADLGGRMPAPSGDPREAAVHAPRPRLMAVVGGLGVAWTLALVALAVGAVIAVGAIWDGLITR